MTTVALPRRKYCRYVSCPLMEGISSEFHRTLLSLISLFGETFQSDSLENSGDGYITGSKKENSRYYFPKILCSLVYSVL